MYDMKILALLVGSLFGIASTEMCSDNATVYEVPKDLASEILSIATTGVIENFKGCNDNKFQVNPKKINFWLWNQANPNTPLRLDHENPSNINPKTKIIFLIHGRSCNSQLDGYTKMKNAYLHKYPDANIIAVDWTTYSIDLFVNTFCYVPEVAKIVSKFICNLKHKFDVDVAQLHIVGHSSGAQLAGLVGQEMKKLCKTTLGRITALDPAGPLFQNLPKHQRLDASDAVLVDVIHCSQGSFGYYGSCGTVDYYPNCGFLQPGCLQITPTWKVSAITNLLIKTVSCSHYRCIDYFTESILSDNFKASSCTTCPGLPPLGMCVPDLFRLSSSVMGEGHTRYPSTTSKYFLTTNDQSPFAKS